MTGNSWDSASFRRWLAGELADREWNQVELAAQIGVTQGVVSRWARGERRPNTRDTARLADVFGKPVDLVLELAGHRPRPRQRNDEVNELIALIETIDWTLPERFVIVRDQLKQLRDRDDARKLAAHAATPPNPAPLTVVAPGDSPPSSDQ